MLELNWDIYDSSKKFVLGSVSMSHVKTEEARHMWTRTMGELSEFMARRPKLLIWQPLTKQEHLKTVPLPDRMNDEYGMPPVVV